MEKQLIESIEEAKKIGAVLITTVEAFHKEPELLYKYLQLAANSGVDVHMPPIKTTDKAWERYKDGSD